MKQSDEHSRLGRTLGLAGATTIGVGAMLGAGVYTAFGPAAQEAGRWLLVGLLIAALVAFANAQSTAALAVVLPTSGGVYAYGSARLGPDWGVAAGWAFLAGKVGSAAAMAWTLGIYLDPQHARWWAVVAIVAVTVLNSLGVRKTVVATAVIVVFILVVLGLVVGSGLASPAAPSAEEAPVTARGVLASAAIMFFAFAGYARLATLGEEVQRPRWTIPRAMLASFVGVLVIYLVVGLASLQALGPTGLAATPAPLEAVVLAGPLDRARVLVVAGASVASLGALVSVTLGLSRTTFAMAADRVLPSWLAEVHHATATPVRAQVAVGAAAVAALFVLDLVQAIEFSACAVLCYYAVSHLSAWTLSGVRRRALAALGGIGCLLLAVTLPVGAVVATALVIAIGVVSHRISRRSLPGGQR